MNQSLLERKCKGYPDVITMDQFLNILTNSDIPASWKTGKKILEDRHIENFRCGGGIKIPLVCVKEYFQSAGFERDRLYYPCLCDENLSFFIAVDIKGERFYHKQSYGKGRKGSLTNDIKKAYYYRYNRFARAMVRYQQMKAYYDNCIIFQISERGEVKSVQSDLCY